MISRLFYIIKEGLINSFLLLLGRGDLRDVDVWLFTIKQGM